jgi:hypothetical protein
MRQANLQRIVMLLVSKKKVPTYKSAHATEIVPIIDSYEMRRMVPKEP